MCVLTSSVNRGKAKMGALRIISDSSKPFKNRTEAGRLLAEQVKSLGCQNTVALGIPRGGVIVANEIALGLKARMDVVLTHKLGAPANMELAIGSVSESGILFVNKSIAAYVGADDSYIEQEKARQLQRIANKVESYRAVLPKIPLEGKVAIITDDGVATGATVQAALWAVRQEKPDKIVLALPVGPLDAVIKLSEDADESVCLKAPPDFDALSRFYLEFGQVEDEQLLQLLENENKRRNEK
jgi:putative phosphoribosyl transferase